MTRAIPLLIQRLNTLTLNNEALYAIGNATNPHIITLFGQCKTGQSNIQRSIIKGCSGENRFIFEDTFKANSDNQMLPSSCNLYGPVKLSELVARNGLSTRLSDDTDIFFCDIEEQQLLSGLSSNLLASFMTMLKASSVVIPVANTIVHVDQLKIVDQLIEYCKTHQQGKAHTARKIILYYVASVTGGMSSNKGENANRLMETSNSLQRKFNNMLLKEHIHTIYDTVCLSRFASNAPIDEVNDYFDLYRQSIKKVIEYIGRLTTERGKQNGKDLAESIKASFNYFSKFDFSRVNGMEKLGNQISRHATIKHKKDNLIEEKDPTTKEKEEKNNTIESSRDQHIKDNINQTIENIEKYAEDIEMNKNQHVILPLVATNIFTILTIVVLCFRRSKVFRKEEKGGGSAIRREEEDDDSESSREDDADDSESSREDDADDAESSREDDADDSESSREDDADDEGHIIKKHDGSMIRREEEDEDEGHIIRKEDSVIRREEEDDEEGHTIRKEEGSMIKKEEECDELMFGKEEEDEYDIISIE